MNILQGRNGEKANNKIIFNKENNNGNNFFFLEGKDKQVYKT